MLVPSPALEVTPCIVTTDPAQCPCGMKAQSLFCCGQVPGQYDDGSRPGVSTGSVVPAVAKGEYCVPAQYPGAAARQVEMVEALEQSVVICGEQLEQIDSATDRQLSLQLFMAGRTSIEAVVTPVHPISERYPQLQWKHTRCLQPVGKTAVCVEDPWSNDGPGGTGRDTGIAGPTVPHHWHIGLEVGVCDNRPEQQPRSVAWIECHRALTPPDNPRTHRRCPIHKPVVVDKNLSVMTGIDEDSLHLCGRRTETCVVIGGCEPGNPTLSSLRRAR